jgi:hypothetical protein
MLEGTASNHKLPFEACRRDEVERGPETPDVPAYKHSPEGNHEESNC